MKRSANEVSRAAADTTKALGYAPVTRQRKQDRGSVRSKFDIPAQLQVAGQTISGRTHNICAGGVAILSSQALQASQPLQMTFAFTDTARLDVSGQTVYCQPHRDGYLIGIRFAPIRDWEQMILLSMVKELRETNISRDQSVVTILVEEHTIAQEAAQLHGPGRNVSVVGTNKTAKGPRKYTPDPAWIVEMKRQIEPAWNAVLECKLVQEASAGTLSLRQMQTWLTQLYPFIETFPKWIALNITKIEDPVSRGFMIDNMRVEKRHAEQWAHMAQGFGINPVELYTVQPIPEVDALTHWLWSINTRGTLAEAVGATNFAIEGVTQGISKLTIKGFPSYDGKEGVRLDKKAYWWMEAHARYDELHPVQALEVIKRYASTKEHQEKVTFAAKRSLEYMLMALEACYS